MGSEYVVHHIGEEIGILEITQSQQIDDDTDCQDDISASVFLSRMNPFSGKEIIDDRENQNQREQAAGLIIEEQADEKQETVAQQGLVLEKVEYGKHDGKECPKIELGEQKRMLLIKRKEVLNEIERYVRKCQHVIFSLQLSGDAPCIFQSVRYTANRPLIHNRHS